MIESPGDVLTCREERVKEHSKFWNNSSELLGHSKGNDNVPKSKFGVVIFLPRNSGFLMNCLSILIALSIRV